MISLKDMLILEDNSEYFGVSKLQLMENAGKGIYNAVKDKGKTFVIFCGAGNNGGDGFVAARYLSRVGKVVVLFFGDERKLKKEGKINFVRIKTDKKIELIRLTENNVKKLDKTFEKVKDPILIDALLGTGMTGTPREPIATAIKMFNSMEGYKVSVDVPSGELVKCDLLVTMYDVKEGARKVKNTKVINICLPKEAFMYVGDGEVKAVLKKRKPDSHKGDNGKALVVGGSKEYVGAVALAGLAALRTGVDWVTVAAPEKVGWAVNCLSPDLVVKKYKGDDFCAARAKDILKLSEGFDAVLIGNGIGMHAKTFCKAFISKVNKPGVVDADAIKAISLKDVDNCILTPHEKELEILLKNSGLNKINKIKNKKLKIKSLQPHLKKNVILLKGHVDVIFSKNKIKYNKTGNPGMTKAGTGDVLAGLAVGFLAQSQDLFNSACAAAFVNGKVGDLLLKKKRGYSFIASDLVNDVEEVLNKKPNL